MVSVAQKRLLFLTAVIWVKECRVYDVLHLGVK